MADPKHGTVAQTVEHGGSLRVGDSATGAGSIPAGSSSNQEARGDKRDAIDELRCSLSTIAGLAKTGGTNALHDIVCTALAGVERLKLMAKETTPSHEQRIDSTEARKEPPRSSVSNGGGARPNAGAADTGRTPDVAMAENVEAGGSPAVSTPSTTRQITDDEIVRILRDAKISDSQWRELTREVGPCSITEPRSFTRDLVRLIVERFTLSAIAQKPYGYCWFTKQGEYRFTHSLPHPESRDQPIGEAVPVYREPCSADAKDAARYRRARESSAWYDDFGRKLWGEELDAAIDGAINRADGGKQTNG